MGRGLAVKESCVEYGVLSGMVWAGWRKGSNAAQLGRGTIATIVLFNFHQFDWFFFFLFFFREWQFSCPRGFLSVTVAMEWCQLSLRSLSICRDRKMGLQISHKTTKLLHTNARIQKKKTVIIAITKEEKGVFLR